MMMPKDRLHKFLPVGRHRGPEDGVPTILEAKKAHPALARASPGSLR